MSDRIRALNYALSAYLDAEMPRPAGLESWAYRDIPKVREDFFDMFIEVLGAENIRWITFATYRHEGHVFKRGQFWLSPAGIERAAQYTRAAQERKSTAHPQESTP